MQNSSISHVPDSAVKTGSSSNVDISDTAVTAPTPGSYSSEPEPFAPNHGTGERPFSLFDYREIWSIGLSLGYLYYGEDIDVDDEVPVGTPKSTEYGFNFGLNGSATFYSWENKLIVHPKACLLLGLGNTYDGSTRASRGGPTPLNSTHPLSIKTTCSCLRGAT